MGITAGAPWRPRPIPHTVFDQPCLDFANSVFTNHTRPGPPYDRLVTSEFRRWFVKRWGLRAPAQVPEASLARLVELRSLIRDLLEAQTVPSPGQLRRLNRILAGSPQVWRMEIGVKPVLVLRTVEAGWDSVMAGIVASYAALVASGEIVRVKHCANPDCAFLFYDSSANRTRRWCDASLCGNLVKVREFRARRRPGG